MVIEGRSPHGGDVYSDRVTLDFSANVNPYGTPKPVRDAVIASARRLQAYPDPTCRPLRKKLSEQLGIKPEEILCGNGAAELIFQFAAALRPPKALLASPCFSDYEAALLAAGCEPAFFSLKREEGFLVTERILDRIIPGLDLLMLTTPNNPTGRSIPRELLLRILSRCRETGTWLFLDECFYELTDEDSASAILDELQEGDRVFLLRAFTKAYGMAGVRLGFGICREPELLSRICAASQTWNVSTPAQAAGAAALDCGAWVEKARTLIRKEKPRLMKALGRFGFDVLPGEANYLFFSGPEELGEKLRERGVLIRDCSNYRGLRAGDWRIAVKTRRENQLLIRTIREVLHARDGD